MHFNMKFLQHTIIRTSFQFSKFLLTKKIQDFGNIDKCLFCMEVERKIQKPVQENKDINIANFNL